jgi:predicted O-methyltransferase YrrM
MTTLVDFYKVKNINRFEGYSQQCKGETEFLKNIVSNQSINNVMEIGFNAGHSAEIFLSSNKKINLVSFDLGTHTYVNLGKEFIDKNYPDRHTLIIGDSVNTVPEYFRKEHRKFDLIFIDGGHSYDVAKADLLNCKNLAHDKTIVILDDTMNAKNVNPWNKGPNRIWKESKELNIIKEMESIDFSSSHGLSWGYYIL